MPNHVTNTMLVFGPKEEVEKAFPLVWKPKVEATEDTDAEPARVDFGLIRPLPADLEGSTSPTRIMTEEELAEATAAKEKQLEENPRLKELGFGGEPGITQAEAERRAAEYGALNWYDWQLANWGTKWNAYECELVLEPTASQYDHLRNADDPEEWGFVVRFDTAWAPPSEWIKHLLHKLKGKVKIEMVSFDEGSYTPIIFDSEEKGYAEYLRIEHVVSADW